MKLDERRAALINTCTVKEQKRIDTDLVVIPVRIEMEPQIIIHTGR